MQKNKFSSVADRRWQHRYERVQQRKERDKCRKELNEEYDFGELAREAHHLYLHDIDIHHLVSSLTFTATTISDWQNTTTIQEPSVKLYCQLQDESELDAGDISALDLFLGEFLTPEVYFQKQ